MKTVQVKTVTVLHTLRGNRVKQAKAQEAAIEKWKIMLTVRLKETLDKISKGDLPQNTYHILTDLERPQDLVKQYDNAIAMLEVEERQILELASQEFEWYMLDQWPTKESWTVSNSKYLS